MVFSRIYHNYPHRISAREKFFNLFRFMMRFKWIENLIAFAVRHEFSFFKKLIPPIYFYKRNSIRQVTRNGFRMNLDLSDFIDHNLFFSTDQYHGLDFFVRNLTKGSTVLDIGANNGFYSMILARACPHGKIIAVEPDSNAFERLQRHASINKFENIQCVNKAIGAQAAIGNLHEIENHNRGRNRILNSKDGSQSEVVDIITIDELVTDRDIRKVDALKIDVEGFELFALQGATNTIKRDLPILLIELSDENLKPFQINHIDVVLELQRYGYLLIDTKTGKEFQADLQPVFTDVLCLPPTQR